RKNPPSGSGDRFPSWEGRDWGAFSLNLRRVADGWDGSLESAVATGALSLPASWPSGRPVSLDLERLALPKMPKETLERARQAQIDPAQLPALTVRSRHVLWQGHDLGQLDCEAEHRPEGLRLKQCAVVSDLQSTSLAGEWWRSDTKDFSRLDGKMKIKDLGRLLEQLGFGDQVVETPAKLKFALQWQDAPQRVAASKLNGDLSVNLGGGALRHVDPGVGRALGLFNIETLKRRLLLDFSDVFAEGLAFDEVRGRFKITDGNAETHNLFIGGPSARVFISGKTDLAGRILDQLVTVVPRTSLAWPILGTLAGGPAVGAAVLLAQQLVGDRLEGITASSIRSKALGTIRPWCCCRAIPRWKCCNGPGRA
ncbi:AsmA-like C-terminal region-containing protein, partial [Methylogaea oryzae]|uniref:YhdP family protein n=1 Tax=Methylogaea oryzae TaxID=1295382 RepID=UPI0026E54333